VWSPTLTGSALLLQPFDLRELQLLTRNPGLCGRVATATAGQHEIRRKLAALERAAAATRSPNRTALDLHSSLPSQHTGTPAQLLCSKQIFLLV